MLTAFLYVPVSAQDNIEFYVSVNGSDENIGSIDSPFATIEKAQAAVREIDRKSVV